MNIFDCYTSLRDWHGLVWVTQLTLVSSCGTAALKTSENSKNCRLERSPSGNFPRCSTSSGFANPSRRNGVSQKKKSLDGKLAKGCKYLTSVTSTDLLAVAFLVPVRRNWGQLTWSDLLEQSFQVPITTLVSLSFHWMPLEAGLMI